MRQRSNRSPLRDSTTSHLTRTEDGDASAGLSQTNGSLILNGTAGNTKSLQNASQMQLNHVVEVRDEFMRSDTVSV